MGGKKYSANLEGGKYERQIAVTGMKKCTEAVLVVAEIDDTRSGPGCMSFDQADLFEGGGAYLAPRLSPGHRYAGVDASLGDLRISTHPVTTSQKGQFQGKAHDNSGLRKPPPPPTTQLPHPFWPVGVGAQSGLLPD